MKYKLIALDVDGTLLTDDHVLTDSVKQAVREVHEAGAVLVLATGRSPTNTLPILEELGLEGLVITHNGAAVVESSDRRVINKFPFHADEVLPVLRYCREHGIHFDVCSPFELYVEKLGEEEKAMYEGFMLQPKLVPDVQQVDEPQVKLSIFSTEEKINRMEQDWTSLGSPLLLIRSGHRFLDVMNPEANKGHALRSLAGEWGIRREEVLAIGNYFNDLGMIEWAGLGIAMSNSPEGVKEKADTVTRASNNENGVAEALREHVLGRV
ncbi:Cof-type HAD-IIB family hydrolase [Paenibacillus aurantius]|uniref:Cof-type HAD-IIB family hydrolase n=1 Tax=Paenibacillus aurantius TaxID=2918900 RepID=A0AA96L9P4_9BACL|nr:Cof-type HAD-IIB family hydrolase [Paenibacillus aurantius]WNQ09714.1 Cof-type HAD-IIB family hydrolase [Paenibacillus aurantius]